MRCITLSALLLAGCVAEADSRAWYRLDGVPIGSRPALIQKFETDLTVCRGDVARADNASDAPVDRRFKNADDVMNGCMAQRGYVLR